MRYFGLIAAWLAFARAQYTLQSTFSGASFFENFDFYNSWDPTFGFVHYVDQAFAQQMDMIKAGPGMPVKFGVDTTQYLNPTANLGRLSLRLMSKQSWTHGLFVIDLVHMPANVCGTWPAFWALGSGLWPHNGEVDIIEFTNNVPNNLMALHTTPGCTVAGADETGTLLTADCGIDDGITGCTVASTVPNNSGATFNANGGGVYAMEWTSTGIRIWFFPRDGIPSSITTGKPDVDEFGIPSANFQGSCDIDAHFYNMSLVFDVDFCGSWAGSVWQANGCPMLDPEDSWASCNQFVALNPSAYVDSYWEVNYLKVYQTSIPATTSPTTATSSVTPAISTSAVSTAVSNAEGRSTTPTMTLAGTVPTEPVGTFTATSSVLSVLSLLSTKSTAESGAATTVIISKTTTSTLDSAVEQTPPTALPPASVPTSTLTSPVIPPPPTTLPPPPPTTISPVVTPTLATFTSTPPSSSCEGNVCVMFTTSLIIQTITAGGPPPRSPALKNNKDTTKAQAILPTSLTCDFTVAPLPPHRHHHHHHRTTDFACTSTRYEIFNGTLVTGTLTASTTITSGQALQFYGALEIYDIRVKTMSETGPSTSSGVYAYTGSFTPTASLVAETTLTAYAVALTALPGTGTVTSTVTGTGCASAGADRVRPTFVGG